MKTAPDMEAESTPDLFLYHTNKPVDDLTAWDLAHLENEARDEVNLLAEKFVELVPDVNTPRYMYEFLAELRGRILRGITEKRGIASFMLMHIEHDAIEVERDDQTLDDFFLQRVGGDTLMPRLRTRIRTLGEVLQDADQMYLYDDRAEEAVVYLENYIDSAYRTVKEYPEAGDMPLTLFDNSDNGITDGSTRGTDVLLAFMRLNFGIDRLEVVEQFSKNRLESDGNKLTHATFSPYLNEGGTVTALEDHPDPDVKFHLNYLSSADGTKMLTMNISRR